MRNHTETAGNHMETDLGQLNMVSRKRAGDHYFGGAPTRRRARRSRITCGHICHTARGAPTACGGVGETIPTAPGQAVAEALNIHMLAIDYGFLKVTPETSGGAEEANQGSLEIARSGPDPSWS